MKLGIIGAGNMGTAMVVGMKRAGHLSMEDIIIKSGSSNKAALLAGEVGAQVVDNYSDLKQTDVIIIMVNETAAIDVLHQLKAIIGGNTVIVSVVPALSIKQIEDLMSQGQPVVSLLPNTVVEINQGIIGYAGNQHVDGAIISQLFNPLGKVFKVNEAELAIFSVLSGCGPAIVDVFIEALSDGAVLNGMNRALSYDVISEMIVGAAKLAQQDKHPAVLKDAVTSPGGSTIKAISTLEKHGFRHALIDAVDSVK
ncbi:pyrroline-5-carboxylate reductase [Staphylococcus caeli]|uniref:pyrroline-5-carboxylate reductase n=1 Tax=Staphylococcus caeli TaxID=2201815 RepID=UPI003F554F76